MDHSKYVEALYALQASRLLNDQLDKYGNDISSLAPTSDVARLCSTAPRNPIGYESTSPGKIKNVQLPSDAFTQLPLSTDLLKRPQLSNEQNPPSKRGVPQKLRLGKLYDEYVGALDQLRDLLHTSPEHKYVLPSKSLLDQLLLRQGIADKSYSAEQWDWAGKAAKLTEHIDNLNAALKKEAERTNKAKHPAPTTQDLLVAASSATATQQVPGETATDDKQSSSGPQEVKSTISAIMKAFQAMYIPAKTTTETEASRLLHLEKRLRNSITMHAETLINLSSAQLALEKATQDNGKIAQQLAAAETRALEAEALLVQEKETTTRLQAQLAAAVARAEKAEARLSAEEAAKREVQADLVSWQVTVEFMKDRLREQGIYRHS